MQGHSEKTQHPCTEALSSSRRQLTVKGIVFTQAISPGYRHHDRSGYYELKSKQTKKTQKTNSIQEETSETRFNFSDNQYLTYSRSYMDFNAEIKAMKTNQIVSDLLCKLEIFGHVHYAHEYC